MKPALSIILFTTIAGAAQGMVVALALATLAGIAPATALAPMLWAATGMLLVALVASFFHLGHPLRAWRTVLMWRTSWMSREVIVLPAFIALVGGWALLATLAQRDAVAPHWLAGMARANGSENANNDTHINGSSTAWQAATGKNSISPSERKGLLTMRPLPVWRPGSGAGGFATAGNRAHSSFWYTRCLRYDAIAVPVPSPGPLWM